MQIQTAQELLARVLGMTKTILRQGQAWARNRAHVGIADQRQNGVIEGGGRDFNSPVLCRSCMGRQDLGQQFALSIYYKTLVRERVIASFFNESSDVGLVEEKFIEPGDLRQDLQVGEVLRRKIFLCGFRRAARVAKVVPQLPVAGITRNQILRISLEKILQRETTLVRSEILRGLGGNFQKRIFCRSGHIVQNLRD